MHKPLPCHLGPSLSASLSPERAVWGGGLASVLRERGLKGP